MPRPRLNLVVRRHETVGSTNDLARQAAEAGAPAGHSFSFDGITTVDTFNLAGWPA